MLHAVAQLAQDLVRHVAWALRDEVYAYAFRPDQQDLLSKPVGQGSGGPVKDQVRLVEEQHDAGLFRVTDLRQRSKQLRQQPEMHRALEPGTLDEPARCQDADHPTSVDGGAHDIVEPERRPAKEPVAALRPEDQHPTLNSADRRSGDVAIGVADRGGVSGEMTEQSPQVFKILERMAFCGGHLEGDAEGTFLRLIQFQDPAKQEGAHVGDGAAHRMALFAEHVPEDYRQGSERGSINADGPGPRLKIAIRRAGLLRPARSPFTSARNTGTP